MVKFDEEKLKSLDNKIKAYDENHHSSSASCKAEQESADTGSAKKNMHIGLEFLSAILLSTFIGYTMDDFFNTMPWIMVGMFFVGFAAGLMNIMRLSKNM